MYRALTTNLPKTRRGFNSDINVLTFLKYSELVIILAGFMKRAFESEKAKVENGTHLIEMRENLSSDVISYSYNFCESAKKVLYFEQKCLLSIKEKDDF